MTEWVFCFTFFFSFPSLPLCRVCAKCLTLLSAWGAGCWKRNSTVCCLRCISRYIWTVWTLIKSLQDCHSLFFTSSFYGFLSGLSNDCRCHHMFLLNSCDSALQHQLTAATLAVYNVLLKHSQFSFPEISRVSKKTSKCIQMLLLPTFFIPSCFKYIIFVSYFNSFLRHTYIKWKREEFHISSLHPPQISTPVDYSNPPTVKNHNEALRCFSLLGTEAFIFVFVFFLIPPILLKKVSREMGTVAEEQLVFLWGHKSRKEYVISVSEPVFWMR